MKEEYIRPLVEVIFYRPSVPVAAEDPASEHDNSYVDWSLRPSDSGEDTEG